jgi:hypothetical protein
VCVCVCVCGGGRRKIVWTIMEKPSSNLLVSPPPSGLQQMPPPLLRGVSFQSFIRAGHSTLPLRPQLVLQLRHRLALLQPRRTCLHYHHCKRRRTRAEEKRFPLLALRLLLLLLQGQHKLRGHPTWSSCALVSVPSCVLQQSCSNCTCVASIPVSLSIPLVDFTRVDVWRVVVHDVAFSLDLHSSWYTCVLQVDTFGTREYADRVVRILDPEGDLFAGTRLSPTCIAA